MKIPDAYARRLKQPALNVLKSWCNPKHKRTWQDCMVIFDDPITADYPEICVFLQNQIRMLKVRELAEVVSARFKKKPIVLQLPEEVLD